MTHRLRSIQFFLPLGPAVFGLLFLFFVSSCSTVNQLEMGSGKLQPGLSKSNVSSSSAVQQLAKAGESNKNAKKQNANWDFGSSKVKEQVETHLESVLSGNTPAETKEILTSSEKNSIETPEFSAELGSKKKDIQSIKSNKLNCADGSILANRFLNNQLKNFPKVKYPQIAKTKKRTGQLPGERLEKPKDDYVSYTLKILGWLSIAVGPICVILIAWALSDLLSGFVELLLLLVVIFSLIPIAIGALYLLVARLYLQSGNHGNMFKIGLFMVAISPLIWLFPLIYGTTFTFFGVMLLIAGAIYDLINKNS